MVRSRSVALLAVAALLVACGTGPVKQATPTTPTAPTSTTIPTTTTVEASTTTSEPKPLDKPLNRMVSAAIQALRHARSFHISLSSADGSESFTFFSNGSDLGSVTELLPTGGVPLQVIELGSSAYVRGGAVFWRYFQSKDRQLDSSELPQLVAHWVNIPPSAAGFGSDFVTSIEQVLGDLAADRGLTPAGTATVLGQRATGIHGSFGGLVLWISAGGTPYPIELSGTTPSSMTTFTHWNAVSPPPQPPVGAVNLPSAAG